MKSSHDAPMTADLAGCEVLIGVCGGIAAYKVCEVTSELVQRGAGVTVAMTRSARKFVGPVTFQALTGRTVPTGLWAAGGPGEVPHIAVTEVADVMLIAPATANIIGKIAAGIADELVSTLVISAASPVVLAPAMNERMWTSQALQQNVATLTRREFKFVGPGEGWLACGRVGQGRMAEPREILDTLAAVLKASPPKGR